MSDAAPEASPAFDRLIAAAPFALPYAEKWALLRPAMEEAYAHHFASSPAFRRYCERRGLSGREAFASVGDIPFLPVSAFKEQADLLRSVPTDALTGRLFSSATSGVPSVVSLDRVTSKRQVRALVSVLGQVLGPKRRTFLVLDADPATSPAGAARAAAIRGFLNLAREVRYCLAGQPDGRVAFDPAAFARTMDEVARAGEPVVLFGFTYVMYADVAEALMETGVTYRLPEGSFVAHIGGWKKLEGRQVTRDRFGSDVGRVFGVPAARIVDFYGFTEQMGVTYPDVGTGEKLCPVFADVLARDPATLRALPDGQEGMLQFVTPLPHSYAGISVLTDDLGVVTARDGVFGALRGTAFRVLGRVAQAEVRGCGDILAEKVVRAPARGLARGAARVAPPREGDARLLFGPEGCYVPGSLAEPVRRQALPPVRDLSALAAQLLEGRARLVAYGTDDLITLIDAAARRWMAPDSPLAPLRQQGLVFLASWCAAPRLRATLDEGLRGARGALDGARPFAGTNRRLYLAAPRGLVAHWLAGNVPLLGMLALSQAIATRNANLLKAASAYAAVIPLLLEAFRGLTVRSAGGRVLSGDDVLASVAVVHFDRDDLASAEALSGAADVRLAWGGREAVEAVAQLPRRATCEDVIFGPKLSFAVIGREELAGERLARRAARRLAVDVCVFDQYACASPHAAYVEEGAAVDAAGFCALLAEELAKVSPRIPKGPIDAGTALAVVRARTRAELTGALWASADLDWSVLLEPAGAPRFPAPTYSRVLSVQAVRDVMDCVAVVSRGIQTVGLALEGERRLRFVEAAAQAGADRFPALGRMTYFDSPWDGAFLAERLVRWVSAGGPF